MARIKYYDPGTNEWKYADSNIIRGGIDYYEQPEAPESAPVGSFWYDTDEEAAESPAPGGNADKSCGLSAAAAGLLITILRNGVYTSDQSANIDAFAAELSVTEPEEPDTPDTPDIPEADITQSGSVLTIVNGVTATQTGNVLAIT